jgi:hypothetical protein
MRRDRELLTELARFGLATALRTHLRAAAFDQLDDDLSMIIDRLLRSLAPQCSLAPIALRIPAMPVTAASAAMTGATAPG